MADYEPGTIIHQGILIKSPPEHKSKDLGRVRYDLQRIVFIGLSNRPFEVTISIKLSSECHALNLC